MFQSLGRIALTVMFVATLAPSARAGGMSAQVEGPARDGRTYQVRTYACSSLEGVGVTAWAERVVNGERVSAPLTLQATKDKGVYQFERSWPADGRWLVRVAFENPQAWMIVATIDRKGRVTGQTNVASGEWRQQCDAKLAVAVH